MDEMRNLYRSNVPCKTAHIVVTHGINVQALIKYGEEKCQWLGHVSSKKYCNYTGIAGGTIYGKGMRMTHGGASSHLRNEAAEIHLESRVAGNENAAFALKAIENSRFNTRF